MNLADVLEQQYFLQSRVEDPKTQAHYRRAVRRLGEFLKGTPTLSDLTDDNVAGLMRWEQMTRGVAAETANHSRKCLVALWRWCRDKDLPGVKGGPTVPKLKVPKRRPRAASQEEWSRLVETSQKMPGSIAGLPARAWWMILFSLVMNSGVRAGELLALRWEWIDWERSRIHVPAEVRKGKREDESYWILPDLLKFMRQFSEPRGLILGWPRCRSRYYQLWDELLEAAGLPPGRKNKTQMIRRTFATAIFINGGDVSAALGQSDPTVARRHYIDPDQTDEHHAERIPVAMRPLAIARIAAG